MRFRNWLEINLDFLCYNYQKIKERVGDREIIAVVKADAYGHGAPECVSALTECGCRFFAVATIEEAIEIKDIAKKVLLMTEERDFAKEIIENDFSTVAYNLSFIDRLEKEAESQGKCARVHIKVDTGMHRLGVPYYEFDKFWKEIKKFKRIFIEGICTHFADAEVEDGFVNTQLRRFNEILNFVDLDIPFIHCANSSAILTKGESYFNAVRPGILLYGLYPDDRLKEKISVKPVLSFKAKISQVKDLKKGESVSYGRTFFAPHDMRIAVISAGYGDGYPRLLSNRGRVIINGEYAKIVGRVCMDLFMVDVTNIKVKEGDVAILIGECNGKKIPVEEVASHAETINYEITTGFTRRVPKVYLNSGKIVKIRSIVWK